MEERARRRGGDLDLSSLDACYRKPVPASLKVGGLDVGIADMAAIIDKGLEHIGEADQEQKVALLAELKARNYVPSSVEKEYLAALWTEFKKHREVHLDLLKDSFKGVPREEIPWFPSVDPRLCSGCSSCVEFCVQGVFTFDGKSHVSKPFSCVVGNSSCRSFCPEKAISFPSSAELRERLKALREKYSIKP